MGLGLTLTPDLTLTLTLTLTSVRHVRARDGLPRGGSHDGLPAQEGARTPCVAPPPPPLAGQAPACPPPTLRRATRPAALPLATCACEKHWCTDRCAQIQISAAAGPVHCRSAGAFPCGPCHRRAALRASRWSSTCCCLQPCSTSTCSPPCWRPQRWRRRRPRSASSASSAGRARYRDRATGAVRDRSASLLGLYRDPYRDRRASLCRDADTLSSATHFLPS